MDVGNPFHFTHIDNMKSSDSIMNVPSPCVVMASPGQGEHADVSGFVFDLVMQSKPQHADEYTY